MRYLTIIVFATLITGIAFCQTKPIKTTFETTQKDTATKLFERQIYVLKKVTENSDFNYPKLDSIDGHKMDTLNIRNLMPVFEPISGQYKYYQFLSTFVEEAYISDFVPFFKDFHDILIIKTDNENKILDAYQYTLEWAEPPLQYDVFRSSAKDITLTDNLDIAELKFIRTYFWIEENIKMKESGIIKLK